VEGRVRPVEAITENEEFEAVGLGVEGSRRGDDGGDAIASKKGLIDILEKRQKIEKDEEDDEDLHFEDGCDDFIVRCGARAREVERKMLSIVMCRGSMYMSPNLILHPRPSQPTSHPAKDTYVSSSTNSKK
jgi:hypothetical protein